MWVKKQQVEHCMEQPVGSRSRKEQDRTVCCHRFFDSYAEHIMRNARLDEFKLASRWAGEMPTTSDTWVTPL